MTLRSSTRIFPLTLLGAMACAAPATDTGDENYGGTGGDTGSGADIQGTIVADWGFRPDVNGFSFINYGAGVSNMDAAGLIQVCGETEQLCAPWSEAWQYTDSKGVVHFGSAPGVGCVTSQRAVAWAAQLDAKMAGGHCEGMAAASQAFFIGSEDIKSYGSPAGLYTANASYTTQLRQRVNLWTMTQYFPSITDHTSRLSPNDAVTELKQTWSRGYKDGTRIGVSWFDSNGKWTGHAVTPYAITSIGDKLRIYVYDSNYPGDNGRYIEVDPVANTSSYQAFGKPGDPSGLSTQSAACSGSKRTSCLGLLHDEYRIIADCNEYLAPQNGFAVSTSSSADVEIQLDDGSFLPLNGDPDAIMEGSLGLALTPAPGGLGAYEYPNAYNTSLLATRITGTAASAGEDTSMQLLNGDASGIRGAQIAEGETASVTLAAENQSVAYQTTGTSTPILYGATQIDGADYTFESRSSGAAGLAMTSEVRADLGRYQVTAADAKAPVDIFLQYVRNAETGAGSYATQVTLASLPALLSVDYVQGIVQVDYGNDGTFEEIQDLTKQN